ncbi:hypothetical protein [Altererythrobacter lauratis]|uniref:Uncharacterized protein n=1 Tax=Alteraurantiacibacter lauratis TaxID=2054627 RepID=A0ABV7EH31_9SPHN
MSVSPYSLPVTPVASQEHVTFHRAWVGHVDAGRIGAAINRPAAPLLEAETPASNPLTPAEDTLTRVARMEIAVLGRLSPAVRALVEERAQAARMAARRAEQVAMLRQAAAAG